MYRGAEGLMCAAGCLIPDDVYSAAMEYTMSHNLEFFQDWPSETKRLITDLQSLHDSGTQSWETGFAHIADTHGLTLP